MGNPIKNAENTFSKTGKNDKTKENILTCWDEKKKQHQKIW